MTFAIGYKVMLEKEIEAAQEAGDPDHETDKRKEIVH